jgi:hypothetical protein
VTAARAAEPGAALIHALHTALYGALVPKRDGTRHHRSCLNRTVNASPTECSPACGYAVGACLLAEDFEDGLFEATAPEPGRREAAS